MAQKKTSTGRTAAKKPSTSSRSGGTKKKTASTAGRKTTGGSRGSAAKKAPAKSGSRSAASSRSTSARTNTAARSGGSRAAAPRYERPMARQIGAVALLFIGLIAVIAYFPVDGWLIGAVRPVEVFFCAICYLETVMRSAGTRR